MFINYKWVFSWVKHSLLPSAIQKWGVRREVPLKKAMEVQFAGKNHETIAGGFEKARHICLPGLPEGNLYVL